MDKIVDVNQKPCNWILKISDIDERSSAIEVYLTNVQNKVNDKDGKKGKKNKKIQWNFKGVVINTQNILNFILEKNTADTSDAEVVFINVVNNASSEDIVEDMVGIVTGIPNQSIGKGNRTRTWPSSSRIYLERINEPITLQLLAKLNTGDEHSISGDIIELIRNPVDDEIGVLTAYYDTIDSMKK